MHLFNTTEPRQDTTNPTGRHYPDPHLDSAYQNLEDLGLDVSDIPITLRPASPFQVVLGSQLYSNDRWIRNLPLSPPSSN